VAQDLSPYQNVLIQHHLFSRTKTSDFRFSLKTHYNLPLEGSNIDEAIDGIPFAQNFAERGMYFLDQKILPVLQLRKLSNRKGYEWH
jgi:hypothetical protein